MVRANILVANPAYRKRAFLLFFPKTGRSSATPSSGHTGSHAPLIHPNHQLSKTGNAPPTAQRDQGGGGGHPRPEHTNVDRQTFYGKNSSKPEIVQLLGVGRSYRCPFIIKLPPTTVLPHPVTLLSLFSLSLSLVIKFPPTAFLSHSVALLSLFFSLEK